MAASTNTPVKLVIFENQSLWRGDLCFFCGKNFKISGIKYFKIQTKKSTSQCGVLEIIKNVFGYDLSDVRFLDTKLCSHCKTSIEGVSKLQSRKNIIQEALQKHLMTTRVKRAAKSSPSPCKSTETGRAHRFSKQKISRGLFTEADEKNVVITF